ncbi:MAG: prolyl-tRNA synthetase associated domain-containing protein [Roseovarius sp.]|nr:prolyl-tRNA synthetase associated domain-containing protein [Roseovarius sp.]
MADATTAHQDSLPVSSDALLARLRAWGVPHDLHEHVPLRTVADARTVQGAVIPDRPGAVHVKNFYLRDKKKRNHLVVLEQDRDVDLKALGRMIGAGGVSFGSPERLMQHLGVRPGAVSPLAMVTGVDSDVRLWMDAAIGAAAVVHVHPLVNDRTVALSPDALLDVLARFGCRPGWLEF